MFTCLGLANLTHMPVKQQTFKAFLWGLVTEQ